MGYHFQRGMKWKKDVLVLSLSDLNNNDFHDYLKPIRTHQIKVPDGEYTFPMIKRYLHVQAGLATDALERPITEALEDQDDAPAGEAGDAGADAKEPEDPKKVIALGRERWLKFPRAVAIMTQGGRWGEDMLDQRNRYSDLHLVGHVIQRKEESHPGGSDQGRQERCFS